VNALGKPQAVALVGVCPYCHESAEVILTKKQVKKLLHGFKLSARNRAVGVKHKCPHCGKPIEVLASKATLKPYGKDSKQSRHLKRKKQARKC
jgi:predicted RNA-binding Zn-ribbon protein involved in translation (DUF1610 family)